MQDKKSVGFRIYKTLCYASIALFVLLGTMLFAAPNLYNEHLTLWQRIFKPINFIGLLITYVIPLLYFMREYFKKK